MDENIFQGNEDRVKKSTQPLERLTRMCDEMTKVFEAHPEHHADDKCMVFLDGEGMGGLILHGYTSEGEAMERLFGHLRAVFRASGHDLQLIMIPEDASELNDG